MLICDLATGRRRMVRAISLVAACTMVLAACGSTPEERGITGAGLGAAGGAIIGAVTGLTVLEGALIGTLVGGGIGLLTDQDKLNLGDPIWKSKSGSSGAQPVSVPASRGTGVAETQANLSRLGYNPGPVDGKQGSQTTTALRRYQRDNGLPDDGQLTKEVALHIADKAARCGPGSC